MKTHRDLYWVQFIPLVRLPRRCKMQQKKKKIGPKHHRRHKQRSVLTQTRSGVLISFPFNPFAGIAVGSCATDSVTLSSRTTAKGESRFK